MLNVHVFFKVGATVQVDFGTPAVKCEAVVNRITDNSLYTVGELSFLICF